jgi:hypothetical protein
MMVKVMVMARNRRMGTLGFDSLQRVLTACGNTRRAAMSSIDVCTAQATVAVDRTSILKEINETVGVERMNSRVRVVVGQCLRRLQGAARSALLGPRQAQRRVDGRGQYAAPSGSRARFS